MSHLIMIPYVNSKSSGAIDEWLEESFLGKTVPICSKSIQNAPGLLNSPKAQTKIVQWKVEKLHCSWCTEI